MSNMTVKRIKHLSAEELAHLAAESKRDGFRFLQRLIEEYESGINTFNQHGEALFGIYNDQQLIAIGGVNKDPFTSKEGVGRLRRCYVSSKYRRLGIGTLLVKNVISHARNHFHTLVLYTDTSEGDRFYRSLGFSKVESKNATHVYHLEESNRIAEKKSRGFTGRK